MKLSPWVAERVRDVAMWPLNLVRDFSGRVRRLGRALQGQRSRRRQLHTLACALFDLAGGPELAQAVMHLGMHTSRLTAAETAALVSVFGPQALRYQDIRIAQGGILNTVFRHNGGRAFATWHTIHLPTNGRQNLALLVHEVTHVFQYERVGSAYIGEALAAQRRQGMACYQYGGPAGLQSCLHSGERYQDFNREAQAQIAQDYFTRQATGKDVTAYETYIAELRAEPILPNCVQVPSSSSSPVQ
jgi:hypothetical protein